MCNVGAVREKTIEDRIRELANPELCKRGDEADMIIELLNIERAKTAEIYYNENRKLEREIEQLKTEVKALTGYIQFKDL